MFVIIRLIAPYFLFHLFKLDLPYFPHVYLAQACSHLATGLSFSLLFIVAAQTPSYLPNLFHLTRSVVASQEILANFHAEIVLRACQVRIYLCDFITVSVWGARDPGINMSQFECENSLLLVFRLIQTQMAQMSLF